MRIVQFKGEYRFLSNFFPSKVTHWGIKHRTVEHAYQAAKCGEWDVHHRAAIAAKPTARAVKSAGRAVSEEMDPGTMKWWRSVNLQIMLDLVRQKFTRHKDLQEKLLETGDAELIEGNTWGDTFFGVCRGTGENHLGKILMKVRKELKEEGKQARHLLL